MVGREEILRIANATIELGEELRELAGEKVPTPSSGVRLDYIPWLSQLGTDAAYSRADCGPAVLAMWLRFLTHNVTVDDVSAWSGLARGYSYTMPAHLIHAARHWKLSLYWRKSLQLGDLRRELDAGKPCIILVNYPSLKLRYDFRYSRGHWLLMTGYTNDAFFYHDPYWQDTVGNHVEIDEDDLYRAWNRNHLNKNSDRQALRSR